MENQEKMLDQVKTSQEQLQQRLDTICKCLEGITTTKYDAQVQEYHQNRLHERELMRSEILGEVTDAIKVNGDKVMDVIQATYNKVMESTSKNLQEIATMVGGLAQMITNQQERIITGVNSAVQDVSKVIADTFLTNQGRVQQGETKLVGGNQQRNGKTPKERGESYIAQDQREAKESRYRRASSLSLDESESESTLSDSEDNQSSTLQKARSSHSANWRGHKSIIPPFTGRDLESLVYQV